MKARSRATGRVWSFAREGAEIEVRVTGYPAMEHRAAERSIYRGRSAYVIAHLERHGLEIDVDLSLAGAKRLRAELDAAITKADDIVPCDDGCTACKEIKP